MSIDREQLARVPSPPIDWQTRAVEALRTVKEQHLALAHDVAANGELQGQIAALGIEADRAAAELARLRELTEAQAETLARVREVAERHAQLSVSNGSWQTAARDVAGKILRALEGK